jgi:hypothetical protein
VNRTRLLVATAISAALGVAVAFALIGTASEHAAARLDFDPALSLCLDCWSREPATAAPSEHNVDAEAVRDISAALQ